MDLALFDVCKLCSASILLPAVVRGSRCSMTGELPSGQLRSVEIQFQSKPRMSN